MNARTHLPIRMVNGVGHTQWGVNEWAFLPPTAANLARLRVAIPPGYPRSRPDTLSDEGRSEPRRCSCAVT